MEPIQNPTINKDWKAAAAAHKEAVAASIPTAWRLTLSEPGPNDNVTGVIEASGLLTPTELEITSLDTAPLLTALRDGKYTVEAAVTAFCKRASAAHQLTNCLTEPRFDEAIAEAKKLDADRAAGKPLGALFGLPMSVKDQFGFAGKEQNMGWASWLGYKPAENAVLNDVLAAAGAVVIARTNVAQGLWFAEGDNNVYGRVKNPYNLEHVPGGSSAGEGPLVGLRGSALGVGTDIGGSIRFPASWCGLFGLRPTTRRFPYAKALNSLMGFEAIESTLGPISNTVAGCAAFSKGVLDQKPWDSDASVVPIPWREENYKLAHLGGKDAKLTIAYYDFDGQVHVTPPVLRAMKETVEALKAAGHTVIPWKPTGYPEAVGLVLKLFTADGEEDIKWVVGETEETVLEQVVVGKTAPISVFEQYQVNRQKQAYRQQMLEQWMATAASTETGRPIDAVLGPVAPHPPGRANDIKYFGYTMVYNLLDWPSLTIPVTTVNKDLDEAGVPGVTGELDEASTAFYDPVRMHGLPVGLQLVGRRYEEETLLGMGEVVVAALKASGHGQ